MPLLAHIFITRNFKKIQDQIKHKVFWQICPKFWETHPPRKKLSYVPVLHNFQTWFRNADHFLYYQQTPIFSFHFSYSGASLETIFSFDFCTALKILICFSLITRFPNDHKRCSSHLLVSIQHRVAPIKVYLTIYESLKNSHLKSIFRTLNKRFWLTSIQGQPYMKAMVLGLKLVYSFTNFIIPLPVTYVRYSWGNGQRLARRLLK